MAKSLIVRVNDRGPYHGNRVIDVSHRAATLLDFRDSGIANVRVEYVGRAPLEGTDDRQLEATLRQGQPAPAPSAVMVASAKPFIPDLPSSVQHSFAARRCSGPCGAALYARQHRRGHGIVGRNRRNSRHHGRRVTPAAPPKTRALSPMSRRCPLPLRYRPMRR